MMARSWKQHDDALRRIIYAAWPKSLGDGMEASIQNGSRPIQGEAFFYWSIKTGLWRATSTHYKRLSDAERGLERFLRRFGHSKQADRWVLAKSGEA